MNHDEVAELAAAYALGALDGEERVRFEALLAAGNAAARAALRDFESTVATLAAETAESPPPAVKSLLMARIDSEERSRGNVTRVSSMPRTAPPRRSLWTVVAVGGIAAGVAAIAVGLAVSTVYERRVGQLAQEQAQLKEELARQESLVTIFQDPATQVASLSGLAPAPEARARLLWHATAGGLLVAQGLPPAPAGKAYELWAITGTGAPVPAGVFAVDARGVGSLRVAPLRPGAPPDTFAVTLEPADGVTAPTGSMYLVGKL